MSCTKAQEVLGSEKHQQSDVHDARKEKMDAQSAWETIKACERVVIAKGKKMVEKIPDEKNRDEILSLAMGRSGNLRAPSLRIGNTLLVGYNEAMYDQYLR